MKRSWLTILILVPLLLAASSAPDDLVRKGTAALDAGDPALAATLFEQAQRRTTRPGVVAYNLGVAKYQLAREGDPRALVEAEQAFRCCLGPTHPRRAHANLGLGNCLLLRAGASPDALTLRAAIDRFTLCLRYAGDDASLKKIARHNQARARLLLLQVKPRESEAAPEDGDKEQTPDPMKEPPVKNKGTNTDGSDKKPEPDDKKQPASKGTDNEPIPTDQKGAPGGPGQFALKDSAEPSLLSVSDASEVLDDTTRRILNARKKYRRDRVPPTETGERDW